uniref:Uncharacterized protein n=1 Tax=Octopus bimaculoides TaxID=37653 RepID=A0A0L8G910_OCTBM
MLVFYVVHNIHNFGSNRGYLLTSGLLQCPKTSCCCCLILHLTAHDVKYYCLESFPKCLIYMEKEK